MKVKHEVKLDRNEMSLMRGFNLKDRKNNTELRELLGLEPWTDFGDLDVWSVIKDDADWVNWCMLMEIEGIRLWGRLKKTW